METGTEGCIVLIGGSGITFEIGAALRRDYRRVEGDIGRIQARQLATERPVIAYGSNVNANDYEFASTKADSIQR